VPSQEPPPAGQQPRWPTISMFQRGSFEGRKGHTLSVPLPRPACLGGPFWSLNCVPANAPLWARSSIPLDPWRVTHDLRVFLHDRSPRISLSTLRCCFSFATTKIRSAFPTTSRRRRAGSPVAVTVPPPVFAPSSGPSRCSTDSLFLLTDKVVRPLDARDVFPRSKLQATFAKLSSRLPAVCRQDGTAPSCSTRWSYR